MLIADGHHRYETALTYRDERGAGTARGEDDDFVMALIVELADEQLTVQAIHRLLARPARRVRPAGRPGSRGSM